jgi:hypothetical protein
VGCLYDLYDWIGVLDCSHDTTAFSESGPWMYKDLGRSTMLTRLSLIPGYRCFMPGQSFRQSPAAVSSRSRGVSMLVLPELSRTAHYLRQFDVLYGSKSRTGEVIDG